MAELFGVPYMLGAKTFTFPVDGVDQTLTRTATIRRWTYIIDPDGEVADINTSVKAAVDSDAVLEKIASLEPATN